MADGERTHWFWKVLLVALPVYYWLAFGRYGLGERDDGFVLAQSWRVINGQLPHRDFISVRPAMSAYDHALSLLLMPEAWEMIFDRLLNYAEMAAASFFLFAAMDRWLPLRRFGLDLYVVSAIGFIYSMHNFPPMAWTTTDGVFYFSLGLYFLSRGEQWRWLIPGLLAVLAGLLTKQSFIAMPPLALAVVATLYGWRALLRAVGVLAGASLLLTLWGAAVGVLEPMIYQTTNTTGRGNVFIYSGLFTYFERASYFLPVLSFAMLRLAAVRWPKAASKGFAFVALACCVALLFETLDNYLAPQILFRRLAAKLTFGLMARNYGGKSFAEIFQEFVHHPGWGDGGMGFNIPFHAVRSLFWLGLGAALATLQLRRVPASVFPLYGLVLAWSCSATNGYPTPALCSGPLVFALFHAAYPLMPRRAAKVLAQILLWGGLAVYSFANCFPYQSKPIWRCVHPMGTIFKKASFIWADERSWRCYSELAALTKRYGTNFKTLPNVPLANYLTNTIPPIPVDWVEDYELPGEWRDVALELDRSGAVVFLRRELMESELLPHYQFGGINSTVAFYVTKTWRKIESGPAFDVYVREMNTSSPLEIQWAHKK
ncbi:MAG: hypothetical protein ACP5UB_08620 [Candidatus Sumerlaeaceae bacterium]|jgi:hypothetical protein